jgi:uncharacterized protein with PhoU and TrkA domain
MALIWKENPACAIATLANGTELCVVKWAKSWGWHIDDNPDAKFRDGNFLLAKGNSRTKAAGIEAVTEAARKLGLI